MAESKNTIYREMVIDLLYRLRLTDDLFCQVTDDIMSAMKRNTVVVKRHAVEQLHAYTLSLQIIYADFLHIIDGLHVTFPAEVSLWQWDEPGGEAHITQTLERLHDIAEGMEMKLSAEMLKLEFHT